MEWRRFFKVYFTMILLVLTLGAGGFVYFAHRDGLPRFRVDPHEMVSQTARATNRGIRYLKKEVSLLPGRIYRGWHSALRYIKTAHTDLIAPLSGSRLLDDEGK